jgi:hypothetical protein
MYSECARDTERNLRLLRFVHEHARNDRDKLQFDQWRPYLIMMHARSVATPLAEAERWDDAELVLDTAIEGIEQFLQEYGQEERADSVGELVFLKRWRKKIRSKLDASRGGEGDSAGAAESDESDPIAKLQRQLRKAIDEERYERAAEIRDQLRRLENPPPPGGFNQGT